MRKKEALTIGELSKRTGIPVKTLPRTLRYWELVSVMTGEPLSPEYEDGRWLGSAIAKFLER